MHAQALKQNPVDERLGRYRLLYRIASGGMADLFLARSVQDPSGRLVVVKRIHDHLAGDPAFRAMLVNEARLCARLCHPSVAQVIELCSVGDTLFIVMEHVEGESLKALVKRVRLSFAQSARIIAAAAAGLHHAHELRDGQGRPLDVVHRDVSPHNILVSYEGEVKVVDFGVAKARSNLEPTERGVIKGKLAYMAPEQVTAGRVDRRTDVFSLGVVLYEMTTSRRLFRGASPAETVHRILHMEIPWPSLLVDDYPRELEQIVMTALQRGPERRFQSAGEMEDALAGLVLRWNSRVTAHRATARSLGRVMKLVFAERIALRRELLARSEAGTLVDGTWSTGSSPSLGPLEGTVNERPIARTRRRRLHWSLLVLAGALLALLLALAFTWVGRAVG